MPEQSPVLPPGQRERATFPRFGLTPFVERFPTELDTVSLHIGGDVTTPMDAGERLGMLPRIEQRSDFHCVTTWTCRAQRWGGVRFADFYREIVVPMTGAAADATCVVFRAQDGARSTLPLEDLLAPDVLLADTLNGAPLSIAHGAPLRLLAPAHYGYKSIKHLNRVEFWRTDEHYRPIGFRFMVHPRARVALEERGRWVPGWILRRVYRPFIRPTEVKFERALAAYLDANGRA